MSATIVDARQVERGLTSLVEAFRRVARTSDRGWLEERDHVISVAAGIPCLLLTPLVATMPPVPGLEVRRVEDAAALLTFNDVCAEAFELDRHILAVLDDPQMLELPGFGFHLGLVDGAPVATAWSCCIDGVVLIFNVATLPSHRRHGHADVVAAVKRPQREQEASLSVRGVLA